ncbi:MAG: hypothetical protein HGB12_13125 [Bacteroidetes bacterium]|nr:hypothetical protein [Bacteroidota bacterium]
MSQNKYPVFKTESLTIAFPKYIDGCMIDSIHTKNDSLIYNINGQIFKSNAGHIMVISEGFNGATKKETPWETLTELVAAYQNKDVDKIIGLYSANSQNLITTLLKGDSSKVFLDYLSKVKKVDVLIGFEYLNGYYAIIETDYGIKSNYFIKENGVYKISALDDKGTMAWNLSLYCKFKPEPLLKPIILTQIDTINFKDNKDFSAKLNKKGNWLIIFKNNPGEPIMLRCMDNFNGMDMNNEEGLITVKIAGKFFFKPGLYSLYIVESNFPATMVSETMIKNALKKDIFVKKY